MTIGPSARDVERVKDFLKKNAPVIFRLLVENWPVIKPILIAILTKLKLLGLAKWIAGFAVAVLAWVVTKLGCLGCGCTVVVGCLGTLSLCVLCPLGILFLRWYLAPFIEYFRSLLFP